MSQLSRREFLKLLGVNISGLLLGRRGLRYLWEASAWPSVSASDLPTAIKQLLDRVPRTELDERGLLQLVNAEGRSAGQLPLVRTKWNQEHAATINRLFENRRWAIVLHWFGDRERYNLTRSGYLEGFNGAQIVEGVVTQTSSHFLVGDDELSMKNLADEETVGIIQTQAPAQDGIPYVSSHLLDSPFDEVDREEQYFVKAYEELDFFQPNLDAMFLELYKTNNLDPNQVSVSIEITGFDFDSPFKLTTKTKIANVVSIVWAIMQRYRIRAIDILGHYEINLEKADPGKNFLSLIRLLVGVKALTEDDEEMKELVFGPFLNAKIDYTAAISKYFKYIRAYLLLVSTPEKIYHWENESKYWFLRDVMDGKRWDDSWLADDFVWPLEMPIIDKEGVYLTPISHEGVDFLAADPANGSDVILNREVNLIAAGECMYLGEVKNAHWGKTAMFVHRLPSGAELVSIYANLSEFGEMVVGGRYQTRMKVGMIDGNPEFGIGYLHFAIAYRGTWDTYLNKTPYVPENVSATWIRQRFVDPIDFIAAKRLDRIIGWPRIYGKIW